MNYTLKQEKKKQIQEQKRRKEQREQKRNWN